MKELDVLLKLHKRKHRLMQCRAHDKAWRAVHSQQRQDRLQRMREQEHEQRSAEADAQRQTGSSKNDIVLRLMHKGKISYST